MTKEKVFKEESELLKRERELENLEATYYMQNLFWDLHYIREQSGHGISPFCPQRIEAHLRLSGETLHPWEYKTLMDMDITFRSVLMKRESDK